jgi:hypothetical protein
VTSVFLSYSHLDQSFAGRLRDRLEERGCQVWIDRNELVLGEFIGTSISEAISRAEFVVILVSAHSVASDWCALEWSVAVDVEVERPSAVILPVRLDDAPMPASLRGRVVADARSMTHEQLADEIVRACRKHMILAKAPRLLPRQTSGGTKSSAGRRRSAGRAVLLLALLNLLPPPKGRYYLPFH